MRVLCLWMPIKRKIQNDRKNESRGKDKNKNEPNTHKPRSIRYFLISILIYYLFMFFDFYFPLFPPRFAFVSTSGWRWIFQMHSVLGARCCVWQTVSEHHRPSIFIDAFRLGYLLLLFYLLSLWPLHITIIWTRWSVCSVHLRRIEIEYRVAAVALSSLHEGMNCVSQHHRRRCLCLRRRWEYLFRSRSVWFWLLWWCQWYCYSIGPTTSINILFASLLLTSKALQPRLWFFFDLWFRSIK